jgi:N-acetylglucosaminyldiphosphoundecaprenol N-acetyl-beta-D-mannosaminyltransferase
MQSKFNKKRIHMFGVDIDPLTMQEVTIQIDDYLSEDAKKCYFVVTPNVDHLVQLQNNTGLQDAYKKAALAIVDGRPVKWAAKILGEYVPCTVPGSDLVPVLFQYFQNNNNQVGLNMNIYM